MPVRDVSDQLSGMFLGGIWRIATPRNLAVQLRKASDAVNDIGGSPAMLVLVISDCGGRDASVDAYLHSAR